MNGFIRSIKILDGYINKINELFQNELYLNEQLKDFQLHPEWAFTEMRAYNTYKNDSNINSIRLNTIIKNETFDDCICNQDGYEMDNQSKTPNNIKKLYKNKHNLIFCYHLEEKRFIKMNSLNMSWVPNYFFDKIFQITKKSNTKIFKNKKEVFKAIIFKKPLKYKYNLINKYVFKLIQNFIFLKK